MSDDIVALKAKLVDLVGALCEKAEMWADNDSEDHVESYVNSLNKVVACLGTIHYLSTPQQHFGGFQSYGVLGETP